MSNLIFFILGVLLGGYISIKSETVGNIINIIIKKIESLLKTVVRKDNFK